MVTACLRKEAPKHIQGIEADGREIDGALMDNLPMWRREVGMLPDLSVLRGYVGEASDNFLAARQLRMAEGWINIIRAGG